MDQLNPSEISELIKQRIAKADIAVSAKNEGTIVSVSDGIVRIYGLAEVMYGEMIEFEGGVYGMALNLERDSVGAVVLGDYQKLAEGQTARCTGRILEVPVGNGLLGRVVDALGNPIDGKGDIESDGTDAFEKVAPGVIARQSVDQPVQTGLKAIDAMVPIGARSHGVVRKLCCELTLTIFAMSRVVSCRGQNIFYRRHAFKLIANF